jgi:hypothetical protein
MPENNETAEKTKETAATEPEMAAAGEELALTFRLLDKAARGVEITIRDDQFEFFLLMEAMKKNVKNGGHFRLIDSGTLDQDQLEWLLETRADFYTSNDKGRDTCELERLSLICRKNRARLACFIHPAAAEEPQKTSESEDESSAAPLDYQRLALTGAHLYFSNGEKGWDFSELIRVAEACRKGGTRLAYFHKGEFSQELLELAGGGAWIHVTQAVMNEEVRFELADTAAAALKQGGGLIIHLQKKPDFNLLEEIFQAGAYIRFEFALIDYRSPLKPIEQAAKKRQPPDYVFYLQSNFLI